MFMGVNMKTLEILMLDYLLAQTKATDNLDAWFSVLEHKRELQQKHLDFHRWRWHAFCDEPSIEA